MTVVHHLNPIWICKQKQLINQGKSLNSVLYDAWAACSEGDWNQSRFYLKIKERHSTKKRGVRRWLTFAELCTRFGQELAEQVKNRKLYDQELLKKEVRRHPELPDSEEQFILAVDHLFIHLIFGGLGNGN